MEELLAEERQQDSGMVDHTDVARKSSASSLSPLNAKAAIVGLAAAMTVEEEGGQMEAATSKPASSTAAEGKDTGGGGGSTWRATLENQAQELRVAKEGTLANRRKLAEATKEFRRKGDAERLQGMDPLLHAYQQAIDALTRRAKAADAAFAMACQRVGLEGGGMDPSLSALAAEDRRRAAALQMEVTRLAAELAECEAELSNVKNQDITLRKLEETVRAYEEGRAGQLEDAIAAAKAEIEALASARVQEAEEQALRSELRATAAERGVEAAEAAAAGAQARLFEAEAREASARAAAAAEMALLCGERERLAGELAVVTAALLQEKENEKAEEEGGAAASGGDGESEMEELAAALAAARQRLLRKEEAWAVERGRLHARVVALEDEVGEERGARVKAEAAVQGLPSVEEVESTKGQLRALMQLLHEEGNAEEGEGEVGGSVEGVLLGRVKRLESELVAARRRVEEAEAACAGMQGALTAAEAQAATQTALLGKLEEDLAAATVAFAAGSSIHHDSSKEQNEEGAGGAVVAAATAAKGEGSGEVNMAALLLSASVSTTPSTAGSSSSSSYHHNLLPILQAQRDRYKARVRVLEHEMEALTATVARERAATVAAKRDNLALYEKIRFLQAYGNGKGGADVEAGGSGGLVMAAAGKAEARCRPVYEEQMNPFAAFSKAERARRYHSLPLTDKAAHSLARLFLKSRPARTFLVMYALALHFLVLVTMYVATHHLCPQALHAPMGLAHPTVVKAAASLMEGQGQQLQQMGGGGGV